MGRWSDNGTRRTAGSMTSLWWRLSQELEAGPHGAPPPCYPVFSKPIVNLKGMGVGSRVLRRPRITSGIRARPFLDDAARRPPCLVDLAVVDGVPAGGATSRQTRGRGTFDYWTIHAEPDAEIEARCGAWVRSNSPAIPACSISRPSAAPSSRRICASPTNGPIFTAPGWVDAVVGSTTGVWQFRRCRSPRRLQRGAVRAERRALPAPACGLGRGDQAHAGRYQRADHLPRRLRARAHAMPPGGFRLAVVNGFDLRARSPRAIG